MLRDDYRNFREVYLVKHSEINEDNRLNTDHIAQQNRAIEMLQSDVKALNKAVEGLLHSNRIISWIGGGLGTLVLSLLFGILIDKIHLIVP